MISASQSGCPSLEPLYSKAWITLNKLIVCAFTSVCVASLSFNTAFASSTAAFKVSKEAAVYRCLFSKASFALSNCAFKSSTIT